jgi:DNA repair exonuclease SbcCD ATPase subunit
MKINRIEIKNFYSIREIKINFDTHSGIVLIEGKNKDIGGSNGSGKSSILEAVVWGIFGRTIRKSTEEALINVYDNKDCHVIINLNNNMKIVRSKRPNFLKFYVGDEDKTQESSTKTQELIEQTLNTNYKTFLASTIFGQHNSVDFIDATPEDKRLIIKNFLNLDDIFSKRDTVKDLKSKYNNELKTLEALVSDTNGSLNKLSSKLVEIDEGEKKFLQENDLLQEDLVNYDLDKVLSLESKKDKLKSLIKELETSIKQYNKFKDESEKEIGIIEKKKVSSCPTCGNEIKDLPQKRIKEIKNKLNEETIKFENNKSKLEDSQKEYELIVIPFPSSKYKLINEWKELKSKKDYLLESKRELELKLDDLAKEKASILRSIEIMKFWEKAFSESGLIKYIIRNILNFLNGKINYYLSYLSNGKFVIRFDEELNEKIYTNGKQLSFVSLSGGEKRKISLATMLGLQSLLSSSKREQTNIMFFDEVGENLDQDGLDGLYILLSELKKEKTLFIITHNNYLKTLIDNCKVLTVTKHHGVSYLSRRNQ